MKQSHMMIIAALVIPAPALAQQQSVAASPAPDAVTNAPVRPIAVRPDAGPNGPNWKAINRKINARAKNAVNNGARPKVVRHKVKAYKQKLRRRWNASQ
ncbi:hypothetical protein [Sphingorhabdus sp. Alg231-15]|uniref:hypothetical protein n=1 Tax=Sphingorhabdus sp. Alg231-15 TaxID=1922222 RepID=UPI000D55F845